MPQWGNIEKKNAGKKPLSLVVDGAGMVLVEVMLLLLLLVLLELLLELLLLVLLLRGRDHGREPEMIVVVVEVGRRGRTGEQIQRRRNARRRRLQTRQHAQAPRTRQGLVDRFAILILLAG